MTYRIQLDQFEGPFDLLLFFIERDELDIYDIPIAKITDDFLAYIRELKRLNIDMASEFIWVAANLMRIKAKMLLPRRDLDESGEEIDPREELVQRLLEFKRYKEVMADFRKLEKQRALMQARGNSDQELKGLASEALEDAELESLTLFRLMKAFDRLMEDWKHQKMRHVHTVLRYQYTIKDQISRIKTLLQKKRRASFRDLFTPCESRMHAIVTFLGILEMANQHQIFLEEGQGINNFWVRQKKSQEEEE